MKEIFKNQTKLDNTPISRMFLLIIVLPPLIVFISHYKNQGRHAMGITGYFVTLIITVLASCYILLDDKTVRKIIIDEDSKKLILIIEKRFRKLSRIQFNTVNLEITEKNHTSRRGKVKSINLKQGNNSFIISSEFKGIGVDDIENINKDLKIHSDSQATTQSLPGFL